ncbi:MAG: rhodanese-like domain-containing protein [Woeseiaceae bacterium]|nr:rhodanese-like domain-containing protein [Woeseiaceae bacterium]
MKRKLSLSVVILCTSILTGTSTLAGDDVESSTATIEVKAASDFVAQDENAVILDVRTPLEFQASHISGAVNVNVQDESFESMVAALDPQKTYIVHCTKNPVDGRSSRALETLERPGFKHLYSLEGGYVARKEAELPLTEETN